MEASTRQDYSGVLEIIFFCDLDDRLTSVGFCNNSLSRTCLSCAHFRDVHSSV